MTSVLVDLTGRRFGMLTVVDRGPNLPRKGQQGFRVQWHCVCDCGTATLVQACNLKGGNSTSCGCVHGERHGQAGSVEYVIWNNMRRRCGDPRNNAFKNYGARGITVSDEWANSFVKFYTDMGPRPSKAHTLEREDNAKGYSRDNCKWATRQEQNSNTRRNCVIEAFGRIQTLAQWCRETGLAHGTVRYRLFVAKWPTEKALTP